ncbi:SUN domain-containing protein 1 isoform X13 [Alligator sinensis]|uniref:SUN domain-containing protein 1 isoform X13 n=1 Tax=Alligator sinensis TaxID=38654 RepID=A0A3Q0HMB3_ALLSI|nr:SUN domain-containing protein 1 isoform X13 [Alligator sinensis]
MALTDNRSFTWLDQIRLILQALLKLGSHFGILRCGIENNILSTCKLALNDFGWDCQALEQKAETFNHAKHVKRMTLDLGYLGLPHVYCRLLFICNKVIDLGALPSSSYSSTALDFETEHKLDPVFDSPRMSRRSLRLITAGYNKADDVQTDGIYNNSYSGNMSFTEQLSKTVKQCKSMSKQSGSAKHTPRKNLSSSSAFSQSSFNSHISDTSTLSTVLDESLIREQTELDHFWGLDDDGDPKGGDTTVIQGNGDLATVETQTTVINGYTCNDCSMLSERKEVLTAYSTSHMPSSRIYSRDRSQKHKSGKAASGAFWWLGTGWYQLVTLISLFNVFLLTRCLPKIYKLLLFLIPLLLLLGLLYWGFEGFLSLLPAFNWTSISKPQSVDESVYILKPRPDSFHSVRPPEDSINFDSSRMKELEKQIALMSDRCHHHDEEYGKVMLLLQKLQDQVALMNDKSEMLTLIKNVMGQHLKETKSEETAHSMTDLLALYQEHKLSIMTLEDHIGKLSAKYEGIQKDLELSKTRTVSVGDERYENLLSKAKQMEQELASMRVELFNLQGLKTQCEKVDTIYENVDAQIKESVKLMFFGDQHSDFSESLLQWLMSKFVSKNDLQTLLQDLEMRILKNISFHMSVSNQKSTSEIVTSAVNAGISGISEAQARIIVNNALKLYSQDKTGMVDFALESGGGSILSTRCSETYETKTALISLFGIPLWYFSQSPRVVIQPEMYPGNCWAFKGSQGYLVVRLSIKIYPTAFTLEHIPKTLSPTGNITSAPKDFTVYGLDDEYQEEGILLGQYMYDEGGEPLQTFQVTEKNENAFQIVELRILSNWGHTEYTCLYRFRVHGRPAE